MQQHFLSLLAFATVNYKTLIWHKFFLNTHIRLLADCYARLVSLCNVSQKLRLQRVS